MPKIKAIYDHVATCEYDIEILEELAVASGLVQDMTGYHNTGEMLFMCSLASFCAAGFVAITEA